MLHLFIKTFCELGIRKGHDLEEQFYVVKVKIEIFWNCYEKCILKQVCINFKN